MALARKRRCRLDDSAFVANRFRRSNRMHVCERGAAVTGDGSAAPRSALRFMVCRETVQNLGVRQLGGTGAVPSVQPQHGPDRRCRSPMRSGPSASDALRSATSASRGPHQPERLLQPRCAVDRDELRRPQPARDQIIEYTAPSRFALAPSAGHSNGYAVGTFSPDFSNESVHLGSEAAKVLLSTPEARRLATRFSLRSGSIRT